MRAAKQCPKAPMQNKKTFWMLEAASRSRSSHKETVHDGVASTSFDKQIRVQKHWLVSSRREGLKEADVQANICGIRPDVALSSAGTSEICCTALAQLVTGLGLQHTAMQASIGFARFPKAVTLG